MRIALVLGTSTGGVGQHVRSLSTQLVCHGHDVVIYGPTAANMLFRFDAGGAEFVPVEIAAGLNPVVDGRAVATLRATLAKTKPDVVHAHGYRAGAVAAAAGSGQPLVVTWHNMLMATGWKHWLLSRMERWVARRADVTLGASQDLVERAWRLGAGDARLAPVAAPEPRAAQRDVAAVRAELGADDRPLVLSVARLHPQKRLDVLIDAAVTWRGRSPAPLVAIAGSGPSESDLRARIAERDAPVVLLGRRSDVPDLLAACDVAVVTSDWEARQLFAQEVLQAGRPLVTTAVGGIPQLVGDGARLVPAGDAAAVAAAVVDLLDDPAAAAALVKRGDAMAATWPTEADTAAQAAAVYAELLGQSGAGA